MFGDQLRLEVREAITWDVQVELATWRQHPLRTTAIAVVFAAFFFASQMVTQLGRQYALGHHLLELPGQAGFAKGRLGVLDLNLS